MIRFLITDIRSFAMRWEGYDVTTAHWAATGPLEILATELSGNVASVTVRASEAAEVDDEATLTCTIRTTGGERRSEMRRLVMAEAAEGAQNV